ncbi:MAG: prolipoprotein diacylglyceryl transferase [Lachnospiraceae bacterium]|nr:prolipoprotein diacylglyceryl transferase [Lachnospiraceae bacterium]
MMDSRIAFPHLGIYLEHVGKTFSIMGFEITYYGVMIAIGMILGVSAVMWRARESGQDPDTYLDIAVITLVSAVVGARIYYVLFSWDSYKDDLISVFNIREGGLAIYGGLIGGAVAIYVLSRMKGIPFARILDTCVIGVPIGQILGRWGNFFNREAFGGYTDSLFAMQLPVSAVRSSEITAQMWDNVVVRDGVKFIQVHPTFIYEGMWNCLVLIMLLVMRKRTKFEGELFLLYLAGYGTGRFFIEMLRTDQLLIPGTAVPVSMAVSAAAVLGAAAGVMIGRRNVTEGRTS